MIRVQLPTPDPRLICRDGRGVRFSSHKEALTPTFTLDDAAIVTQAATIFTALGGVAVVAIGVKLGLRVLKSATRLF